MPGSPTNTGIPASIQGDYRGNFGLEARGRLVDIILDPTGAYHVHLGRRYGEPDAQPPAHSPDRVILMMSVDKALGH